MTELELRRGGSRHCIALSDDADIVAAAQTLERWARDWERSKRKRESV